MILRQTANPTNFLPEASEAEEAEEAEEEGEGEERLYIPIRVYARARSNSSRWCSIIFFILSSLVGTEERVDWEPATSASINWGISLTVVLLASLNESYWIVAIASASEGGTGFMMYSSVIFAGLCFYRTVDSHRASGEGSGEWGV